MNRSSMSIVPRRTHHSAPSNRGTLVISKTTSFAASFLCSKFSLCVAPCLGLPLITLQLLNMHRCAHRLDSALPRVLSTAAAQGAHVRPFSSSLAHYKGGGSSRDPNRLLSLSSAVDERPLAKEASVGRSSTSGLVFATRRSANLSVDAHDAAPSFRSDGLQVAPVSISGPLPASAYQEGSASSAVTGLPSVRSRGRLPTANSGARRVGEGTLNAVAMLMSRYVPAPLASLARGAVALRVAERRAQRDVEQGRAPHISPAVLAAATTPAPSSTMPKSYIFGATGKLHVHPASTFAAHADMSAVSRSAREDGVAEGGGSAERRLLKPLDIPVVALRRGLLRAAKEVVSQPGSAEWHRKIVEAADAAEAAGIGIGGLEQQQGARPGAPSGGFFSRGPPPSTVGASSPAVELQAARLRSQRESLVASLRQVVGGGAASSSRGGR